jgi:hypothetical protein
MSCIKTDREQWNNSIVLALDLQRSSKLLSNSDIFPPWFQVESTDNNEGLPLVYSPEIISAYWGRRPRAVATRVVQLLSVAGGFISHIISDLITDKLKEVAIISQHLFFCPLKPFICVC